MKPALTFLLGFVLLLPLVAQNSDRPDRPGPVIRAMVEMVNVVFTVRDKKGRYVSGLQKTNFEVYEDGVKQDIQFFNNETGDQGQSLTVVLLVDTSGSVKEKLAFEQEAATEFLRQTLRANKDLAAVIEFNDEVNVKQDFTFDQPLLEKSILRLKAGGTTKLYDAIWLTSREVLKSEVGRKVIVILSDGDDTSSQVTNEEAIRAAQDEDVIIFGIGVESHDTDFGQLKKFARSTGGLFFNPRARLAELQEAFAAINKEVKNQYSLAYVSTNERRDGEFREIDIRVSQPGLKVSHRKGYYSPQDERGIATLGSKP